MWQASTTHRHSSSERRAGGVTSDSAKPAIAAGMVLLAASVGSGAPATTVSVIQPAGGETWSAGTTVSVEWGSTNPAGYVDIQLEQSGVPFVSIGYAPMIQGYADWEICEALGDGADYRIRIIGEDAGGAPVEAVSELFSISGSAVRPTLAVTSPVGGESWTRWTTEFITWSSTNPVGAVYVDLLKGGMFDRTLAYVPMADGEAEWRIRAPVVDGDDYRIRVSADGCGSGIEAEGGLFSITDSPPVALALGQPAGGESWEAGSTRKILWEGLNLSGYIYLDLLRAGQWSAHIAQAPAADGEFDWDICPGIGDGAAYRVRAAVTDGGGGVFEALSPEFAITGSTPPPALHVTRPAGGETWWQTATESVEWASAGTSETLSVGLIKDGEWFATLGRAPAADGIFAWTVSPEMPRGSHARIALRLTDCGKSIESVGEAFTVTVTGFDLDLDGDVDQNDFMIFESCAGGPTVPLPNDACAVADFDGDGDGDHSDFGALQACMSGPNVGAEPGCGMRE